MKLYRTKSGPILEHEGRHRLLEGEGWDDLLSREDLPEHAASLAGRLPPLAEPFRLQDGDLLAPIEGQEVWAAGVTYFRSRDARMEEAQASGGGSFYDRVYTAERPELFFKASPHRVAGPGQPVRIRKDSRWMRHFYTTGEKLPFRSFWKDGQPLLEPLAIPDFHPVCWKSRWQGVVV